METDSVGVTSGLLLLLLMMIMMMMMTMSAKQLMSGKRQKDEHNVTVPETLQKTSKRHEIRPWKTAV